jgi:uncharacterized membrane protein
MKFRGKYAGAPVLSVGKPIGKGLLQWVPVEMQIVQAVLLQFKGYQWWLSRQ